MNLYEASFVFIIFGFSALFVFMIFKYKKFHHFTKNGWRLDQYDKSNINYKK